MVLCFHWNDFKYAVVFSWSVLNIYIHVQMLSDYTMI